MAKSKQKVSDADVILDATHEPKPKPQTRTKNTSSPPSFWGVLSVVLALLAIVLSSLVLFFQVIQPQGALGRVQISLDQALASNRTLDERVTMLESADPPAFDTSAFVDEIDVLKRDIDVLRALTAEVNSPVDVIRAVTETAGTQDASLLPRLIAVEEGLAVLSQSNANLAARFTELSSSIETLGSTDRERQSRTEDFRQQLDGLQTDLTVSASKLAELSATVAALNLANDAQTNNAARGYARQLAIARLREALVAGDDVATKVDEVRPLVADDVGLANILAALDLVGPNSAPTTEQLQAEFLGIWDTLQLDSQLAQQDGSTWSKMWTRTKNLLGIRRVAGEEEIMAMEGVPGHLARTNFFLKQGNLTNAAAALAALDPPLSASAQAFARDLDNRIAYNRALVALDRWALALLAADPGN